MELSNLISFNLNKSATSDSIESAIVELSLLGF